MHGRLKVKTSAELEAQRLAEKTKQKKFFVQVSNLVFEHRDRPEFDGEQLKRTAQLLLANADVATFWNLRKDILLRLMDQRESREDELQRAFKSELELTQQCLGSNPKSYCTWHHRRFCLLRMEDRSKVFKQELRLCNKYLELDERNFHVWDHRRFVAKEAGIDDQEELDYTRQKIDANFSNYSAWQRRSRLLTNCFMNKQSKSDSNGLSNGVNFDEQKLLDELELVQNAAFTDPDDSSAFFYHTWIMGHHQQPSNDLNCLLLKHQQQQRHLSFGGEVTNFETLRVVLNKAMSSESLAISCVGADDKIELKWHESDAQKQRKIFTAKLSNIKKDTLKCLRVSVEGFSIVLDINLDKEGNGVAFHDDIEDCSMEREGSSKMRKMLETELESCDELLEYEPDSKWPLITKQMLLIALDPRLNEKAVLSGFEKLATVDSIRKGFYEDWRSRFVVQSAFQGFFCRERKLDLSSKGITCISEPERLAFVDEIDLSNNKLRESSFRDFLKADARVLT